MKQVWKSSGVKPPELADMPPFPEELRYAWNWYLEMNTSESLTYAEVAANVSVMGVVPEPFEVDLFFSLDRVRLKVAYE